jgi:hypothetical protein
MKQLVVITGLGIAAITKASSEVATRIVIWI